MMILRTRKEQYLNEIVGNGNTAPGTPYTREELFFADILGEVNAPAPVTRIEIYLAKIANKYSGELPQPKTRIEKFIARAAGMDVIIPTPITREEMLWANYALIVEKEISGIPPLTFNAIAGTLKNYRIYGNTKTKTRSYSGTAPLSFPITDGGVSNYRIYGNTINGESVGDLVTDSQSEHYGKYAIPITNNSETANIYLDEPLRMVGDETEYVDYATQKRYNADGTNEDVTLPALPAQSSTNSLSVGTAVQPSSMAVDVSEIVSCGDRTKNLLQNAATSQTINGVTFTVNSDKSVTCNGTATQTSIYMLNDTASLEPGTYKLTGCPAGGGYVDKYKLDIVAPPITYGTDRGGGSSFTSSSTFTNARYRIVIYNNQICDNLTFYPMVRKADIEDGTYEPYGYKIPVTLTADSAETTDIYLDEPLAKSGNNADYIDYATQKRRNSDGTESTVTLPEIAVTAGTNMLTVGTEVQPSNVYIKYEGVR